jgi:hypothetical protein
MFISQQLKESGTSLVWMMHLSIPIFTWINLNFFRTLVIILTVCSGDLPWI